MPTPNLRTKKLCKTMIGGGIHKKIVNPEIHQDSQPSKYIEKISSH